jgi:hypothetical protein
MNQETPENIVRDPDKDSGDKPEINEAENAELLFLLDTRKKCAFIESSLGKENFVLGRISSSVRSLHDSIPNRTRMSRTVDNIHQDQLRKLLREASSITIEARRLREAASEAGEEQLTPEIIESVAEIYKKLNRFATQSERAIEEISGTIRIVQRWVDEGIHKRILSPRVGGEIHTQARHVKFTLNKFKEECVNPSLFEFRLLARQIEAYRQPSADPEK